MNYNNSPEYLFYEVLLLKENGFSNYVIARTLGISEESIKQILNVIN